MSVLDQPRQFSNSALWAGRILLGLCSLFLLMDAVVHVVNPAVVIQASAQLGFPDKYMQAIGVVELIALASLIVPRTRTIGALFFTAYLGGATALQVRIGGSWVFAIVVGVVMWTAVYLVDARVRGMLERP